MTDFGPLVTAQGDGTYEMGFPDHICELLVWLSDQLDTVLDTDSPQLTRLFPTAYPGDAEMDAGYQILAHGQLVDYRRQAIQILRETAKQSSLDEDQLTAWMRVVNDLRLVIGTRLDVSEDDDFDFPDADSTDADSTDGDSTDGDPADPDEGLTEIYHLLGLILSHIVDALTGDLPVVLDEPLL